MSEGFDSGRNYAGQLGDGTPTPGSLVPVVVRGLADVIQIDSEHHLTCAVRENGTVACWGQVDQSWGGPVYSTPVDVPNLSDVVEVSVGESHLCARLRSSSVTCIGKNDRNQLGTATPSDGVGRSTIQGLDHVVKLTSFEVRFRCAGTRANPDLAQATSARRIPAEALERALGPARADALGMSEGLNWRVPRSDPSRRHACQRD